MLVVRIRELARRPVELDFLERAQRHGLRAQVVLWIFTFVHAEIVRRLERRTENRQNDEIHRSRGQQDSGDQLEDLENALAADLVELVAQALELGR